MLAISLPSLGVKGALPLLESPVELAGLSLRANGGTGITEGTGDTLMAGNIALLLGLPAELDGLSIAEDDRLVPGFEGLSGAEAPEAADDLLMAAERIGRAVNAVPRLRVASLLPITGLAFGDDCEARESGKLGFRSVLLRCLVLLLLLLLLLARLSLDVNESITDVEPEPGPEPDPEPVPLLEVATPFLIKGGRDMTLKEGVGCRCLIGIGAMGGSVTFSASSSTFISLSFPLSFPRPPKTPLPFRRPSLILYSSRTFASLGSTFSQSSVFSSRELLSGLSSSSEESLLSSLSELL